MEFRAIDTSYLDWSGDGLALSFFEEQVELTGDLAALDEKLAGTLKELIEETEFEGKEGSSAAARVGGNSPIRKVILMGLGKQADLKLDSLRRAAAAIARLAKQEKCQTLGIHLPIWNEKPDLSLQVAVEGIELALHQDNRFKSEPEDKGAKLTQIDLLLGVSGQEQAIAHETACKLLSCSK